MNELSTLSARELKSLKSEITGRRDALMTKEGFDEAKKVMIAMFDYLSTSGYKLQDVDYDQMAGIYADQLREHIVVYGYDVIKKAVREFVRSDTSTYHQMPTAGQLIAVIESTAGNPIHAIKVQEHEELVRRMETATHAELLKKAEAMSDAEWKRLEEKYERNRED